MLSYLQSLSRSCGGGKHMGKKTRINYPVVVVLSCILFEAGLVANATGAVIPDAIRDLRLSYSTAALLPFMYFIAYGLVSIPVGILCERVTPKAVILASFVVGFAGALSFALFPSYPLVLLALFAMGCWLAAGQVPLFPMMRVACGGENLAFFTALATLMYGMGSILSPHIYASLVRTLQSPAENGWAAGIFSGLVSHTYPWVSVYWIFAATALLTVLVLAAVPLPRLAPAQGERTGALAVYLRLIRNRTVVFYALAVVCYCACEQGCSNWMSEFMKVRHGLDPQTAGASVLSWYWLLLTAGCLGGMLLVKIFDTRRILVISASLAAASLTGAIFGGREAAIICFPLVGLFESVLWPILVELALNSVGEHHGALMGILMSSVVGGAFGPFVVGRLADIVGLQVGLTVLYAPFLFICYVGISARPLIRNATLFDKQVA